MEAGSQSSTRQPIDVIFNSAESDNGNVDFPNFTLDPPLDNIVGASVQWISAPFSYYVIDRTNNTFRLGYYILVDLTNEAANDIAHPLSLYNLNPDILYSIISPTFGSTVFQNILIPIKNGSGDITCLLKYASTPIYLTPGSYTPESLEKEINKQMQAAYDYNLIPQFFEPPTSATYDVFSSFSVQLNPNTSRLTISNPNIPTGFVYTDDASIKRHARAGFFLYLGSNESLCDILGFTSDLYISSLKNTGETQTANVDFSGVLTPFSPEEFDTYVAAISAPRPCNFIQTNKMNLHSNLATLMSVARTSKQNNDILTCIPIDTNYSQYILNVQTAEMKMLTRCVISNVQFYMTLGNRRRLFSNSGNVTDVYNASGDNRSEIVSPVVYFPDLDDLPFTTQPYIHFNGEPFMVCIRFYRDDGQMAQ